MSRRVTQDSFEYEKHENVGIWHVDDFEHEMDAAESHYRDTANRQAITATLVVFDSVPALSGETQAHINEAWSQLGRAVDVEKLGYVADGIAAMAVTANMEVPDAEVEAFEDLDEAKAWATA